MPSFRLLSLVLFPSALILAAPAASPEAPKLRLSEDAKPVRYRADITVDSSQDRFQGSIEIDLAIGKPLPTLWLNATDLKVEEARLTVGEKSSDLQVIPGGSDFVGLQSSSGFPAGDAKLSLRYSGRQYSKDASGLFRRKINGDWYSFTQFEPIDARRVFPCFDEPGFKVPWQLTLHVPKGVVALSNTPSVAESDGKGGSRTIQFAETKPLPSYLIAFAVGPFDVLDAGKAGRLQTPIRLFTPKGQAAEARYAAETTPRLLTMLEDYFDIAYPFGKLDQVAIPDVGYAMEHPGLITYAQNLLQTPPEKDTLARRRSYVSVAAHELAHQWFGNLVTMAWWDDTWLNESFASWMGDKIMEQFNPTWHVDVERVESRSNIMARDRQLSARQIRQPIGNKDDISDAFDGITYEKGEAVLGMFENYVGPREFQAGVRAYLKQYSFGNATVSDFLRAIDAHATRPVSGAFRTFLDQPGVPSVQAELLCASGQPPALILSQMRALSLGVKAPKEQLWQIPVCVKYSADGKVQRQCELLTEREHQYALRAQSCPAWLLPNEGAIGYYRPQMNSVLLSRTVNSGFTSLTLAEQVGLERDIPSLVASGDLAASEALKLLPALLKADTAQVVESSLSVINRLLPILPEAQEVALAPYIRSLYSAKARQLGWRPQKGESEELRLLRPELLPFVVHVGRDAELGREAAKLARAWTKDRKAIEPDLVGEVLESAIRQGDASLFDELRSQFEHTRDRHDREAILSALASTTDLEKAKQTMALLLTDRVRPFEVDVLISGFDGTREITRAAYAFMKEHYSALIEKMPREEGAALIRTANGFCTEQDRRDVEHFFQDKTAQLPGGPRALASTLESIRACENLQRVQLPSIEQFLAAAH